MFDMIARLIRQKMLFVTILVIVAVAGIVAAHGWSWTTALVVVIAAIVLPSIWALSAFWIWAFRNSGQSREQS